MRPTPRSRSTPLALALVLATALSPTASAAQDAPATSVAGTLLRGTVRDSADTPIAGAIVTATDPNGRSRAGRSEATGAFRIAVPGAGRYVLTVRALGHEPTSLEVDAGRDGAGLLAVRLRSTATLATVQIVGDRTGRRPLHPGADALAGSVSVLGGAQIAREQVAFAQELLRKVPGIYRAEFNQGIVSGDIGVRGFNTESEIGSTKLLVDGIPSNLNSGVSEMNALFPLEIEQIEVVRGTQDPRVGLFNLAGNVGVTTREGGRYLTSRVQGGSFGTAEAQVVAASALGPVAQTLFLGGRRSDGYRANARLDKWTASGKWFTTLADERVRLGVIGRVHRLDTQAPGYLTFAESRATPTFSPAFSDSDGGTVASDHGSLHVDVRQSDRFAWSLKAYGQRFDRVRFVRFTATGAQQERVEDERQQGLIALATWRPAAWAPWRAVVTAGVDAQWTRNLQLRFRTAERVRQATLRDYDFALDNRGGFVQLGASPHERVQLQLAVRTDKFFGDFTNRTTPASVTTAPLLPYGWITQPKGSVTVQLHERASIYANGGRGFQIGSGIAAYGTQRLRPSVNDGWESGIVSTPFAALSLRAGVWEQRAADEVRLRFDNSGDSENIGRTRRSGVDVEATLRLPSSVSAWVATTSQRARLVEPGPRNVAQRGNRLNHVPDWTAKYGLDWAPRRGLQLSAWAYAQGDYEITPANDRGRWGDLHLVNADLSWRWRSAALGLGVTNLFDRYGEYVWWDGTQTLHSPAAGRALFVTVTLDR
ncbi:MAG: TonB-dependent receptor [Gemmatimonadaceae bacterium]|nr:TonB-dependent receptor [Gemmatimonadaceae bacterium]